MIEYMANVAQMLAHSAVFFAHEEYSPGGVVDDAVNEDNPAYAPQQSAYDILNAYNMALPGLMSKGIQYATPLAQAMLGASAATDPQRAALQARIYENVGPRLAKTAADIDAINKQGGAASDLATLQGAGGQSAREVYGLMQQFDPEFFQLRSAAVNPLQELMSGQLTGGETEAIQRSINRQNIDSGLWGNPASGTQIVGDAMQFGDAARQRQMQGVGAVTSFLPVSRTNFDPSAVALGRPSINAGDTKFSGVTNPGQGSMDTANNVFGAMTGLQTTRMQSDADRRDWLDRNIQAGDSLP